MASEIGLLRVAYIDSLDLDNGQIIATLDLENNQISLSPKEKSKNIRVPFPFFSNDGLVIGGYPTPGTSIIVGQREGGQWCFVSYYPNQEIRADSNNLDSSNKKAITLDPGTVFLRSNFKTQVSLSQNDITLGNSSYKISLNTKDNYSVSKLISQFSFTEASRNTEGIIRRDIDGSIAKNIPDSLRLSSSDYESRLIEIGLDPKSRSKKSSSIKNPAFIEKREMLYEFEYNSNVKDDVTESNLYSGSNSSNQGNTYTFPNRRASKTDTLSLSLVAPNFLMETIKGTVVDIFGNILDINRVPIPIGIGDLSLKSSSSNDKQKNFLKIKEAERNSVAFHFEINARKDLKNGFDLKSTDFARQRSRFSLDINKEGLFKLNVPATSSTGSVPFLARYENYSTFGAEDNNNPNKLIARNDNLDLFLDSFAYNGGTITINSTDGYSTPLDRILSQHIKHGTVYHDIVKTCNIFTKEEIYKNIFYQYGPGSNRNLNFSYIKAYNPIVSDTIDLSSTDKNAGGRSGSINLDGSLELNIGANTIDKQSLWIDLQGGIVGNIGQDKQGISTAVSSTGDILVEIGSIDINQENKDSRFNTVTSLKGKVLDIRVRNSGTNYTIFRIDDSGLTVITPTRITMASNGDITIKSHANINISGEAVDIQGRRVARYEERPVDI